MSKKLTLNETWEYCLSMWQWIAKEKKAGSVTPVAILKSKWLENNWSGKPINATCFFCEYGEKHPKKERSRKPTKGCMSCPATQIDLTFYCMGSEYDYGCYPIAFYNKLVSLNRKRLKTKKSHSKPAQRKAAE